MPTSKAKPKVLFVIGHLVQSGAERFTYEVLRAIDRERFDVALLTKARMTPADYYYEKIQALGIPIHHRLPLWYSRLQRHARRWFLPLRKPIELVYRLWGRFMVTPVLEQYDVINCVQIENYLALQPLLRDNRKVIIYLMAHRFQYQYNPLDDCLPGRGYRFAIFDPIMREEWEGTPAAPAEEIHFPLAIDLSATRDLSEHARLEPPYRIGVFVRLAHDRPLGGVLHAFAKLREKGVDAELWLYGRGDPSRFARELDELGIRDRVVFPGHTTSIEKTLREDGLSMVWMTCFSHIIAYASIEVASFAFPTLFWNQHGKMTPEEIRARTGGAIEGYFDPAALAEATYRALQDAEGLRERGRRLRAYVLSANEIANHIRSLEGSIAGVATESSNQ
ncbi:MAG TPA: glycosyltransferase [Thermoanaerobaculia bacterium]|nr:glycosyltransferase [Thermoanaerobaculia bacterium]